MDAQSVEEFFSKLEAMGEDKVRQKLALSHFGDNGGKKATVQLWLEKKDQERLLLSNEASKATARSAKNAAWAAAIAAIIAAVAAIVSALISFLD